ncbi:MAG: hypothetical protein JST78_01905 [Bacteroidetes bacterium]|nr:hypothetical protein [Bacteroidota bacterium]
MESAVIEQLLEKYFEGETTLAQEQELRAYFSSDLVAEHLKEYQAMFAYYNREKEQTLALNQEFPSAKKTWKIYLAAASVAVLLGVGYFTIQPFSNATSIKTTYGTYDDPEVAFRETRKALELLSGHVNVGVNSIQYIETYEETKNKIFITE